MRGGNKPSFAEGGQKPGPSVHFEHNEPPTASEAVRQQQAGATQDAEMQMAMNQTGGGEGEELTVPQSGAASPEGNDAMAQSAGMLMQSRQNAPANTPPPDVKTGGFRRRTRRKRGGQTIQGTCSDDTDCAHGYYCDEDEETCAQLGGRRKRRTRRRKKRRKSTKKKRRRRKRKTKRKYKIARKYRQKGCSRKRR